MVRGTKSSGTGYSADAVINISAKTVTVTGNQQMTAAAGQNIFEITLLKSGKEISSKNFILLCERAALDADTITDESVLKELNAIIESADTATQAAEEAEDAADRAEAAAQTLVIDSTLTQEGQAADAKATGDAIAGLENEIAQIVPGLSSEAKDALLACFEHVAWIDEHGQDYYDALESALYGSEPQWDYEWDSSSRTLPDGMTATEYDFTTENGVLFAKNPRLDFEYTGDCKMQIEIKAYSEDSAGEHVFNALNNPQFQIKNAEVASNQFRGIKMVMDSTLGTSSGHGMVAVGINGTNSLIAGSNSNEYHIYEITAINNVYSLFIDSNQVELTQTMDTTAYIAFTGIGSSTPTAPAFMGAFIKSIKFKRL
jgi:hypothetical protein